MSKETHAPREGGSTKQKPKPVKEKDDAQES